jgi:hypothetical protein
VKGQVFSQFSQAFGKLLASTGADWQYGRRLYADVYDQDLVEVGAEGLTRVRRGGTPEAKFWQLSLEQLRERLIPAGLFSEQQITDTLRLLGDSISSIRKPQAGWCRASVPEPIVRVYGKPARGRQTLDKPLLYR